MTLQRSLRDLAVRLDGLSFRERLLILAAGLVVLYAAWDTFLFGPTVAHQEAVHAEAVALGDEVRELDQRAERLATQLARESPDEPGAEVAALEERLAALDETLAARMVDLIDPEEMAHVLERVLLRETDLRLKRLETLGAAPILEPPTDDDVAGIGGVYRHGLELRFEGSYLDTLAYLEALESLPWRLYWDSIVIDVQAVRQAAVTIRVHTLSLDEDWIGV